MEFALQLLVGPSGLRQGQLKAVTKPLPCLLPQEVLSELLNVSLQAPWHEGVGLGFLGIWVLPQLGPFALSTQWVLCEKGDQDTSWLPPDLGLAGRNQPPEQTTGA